METAKNLALSGVASLVLHDVRLPTILDLGVNCFLTEADLTFGMSLAQLGCAPFSFSYLFVSLSLSLYISVSLGVSLSCSLLLLSLASFSLFFLLRCFLLRYLSSSLCIQISVHIQLVIILHGFSGP